MSESQTEQVWTRMQVEYWRKRSEKYYQQTEELKDEIKKLRKVINELTAHDNP